MYTLTARPLIRPRPRARLSYGTNGGINSEGSVHPRRYVLPGATALLPADPSRIGGYRLAGRLGGSSGGRSGQVPPPGGPGAADGARPRGPAPFVVYLGSTADGGFVTITLLQPVSAADTAARDRFMAEADAARRVAPLCVARLLDAGFHGDFPYLVSEHVAGPSLAEVISANGALGEKTLRAVAIGAATGLAAIHQAGLVHGHFGPGELVLGADGPRVVHSGITPPYGLATPAADVLAWAHAVLGAASGSLGHQRADPQLADLGLLPSPLRQMVRESLGPDPASRPSARVIVTRLLGPAQPSVGILAAGSRAAARTVTARTAARRGASAAARTAVSAPGGHVHLAHRPTRRRPSRGAITAGVAAAVVAAAAMAGGGAAVMLSHGGATAPRVTRHAPPGRSQAATPPAAGRSATAPSPAAPPPAPSPAVRIPGSLSGTWTGQVRQDNPPLSFAVQVLLRTGATVGTVSYPSLACSGVLTLTGQDARGFVFRQGIVSGQQTCGPGTVTLTGHGTNLGFVFTPAVAGGPALRGTLSRLSARRSPGRSAANGACNGGGGTGGGSCPPAGTASSPPPPVLASAAPTRPAVSG